MEENTPDTCETEPNLRVQLDEAREMLGYYVKELRRAKAHRTSLIAAGQQAADWLARSTRIDDREQAQDLRDAIALTQKEEG